MAKIKRTVSPSVGAPDLTRSLQRIDIPRDAFGANVGAALADLGGTVAESANRLNLALGRNRQRQDVIDATAALGAIELEMFTDNEVARKDAIGSGKFIDFATDRDVAFKKKTDETMRDLSKGAAAMVSLNLVRMRTQQAKSNVKWANDRFVEQGRNQIDSTINNIISTGSALAASGNLDNLAVDYDRIRENIILGVSQGFFGLDLPDDLIEAANRKYSLGIINGMMQKNPASIINILKTDVLKDLTEKDKLIKSSQAESSLKSINERAKFSRFSREASKHTELSKRVFSGDPTLTVSEIENSGLPDWAIDYWIEEFSGSEEGKIRKRVKEKERNIEADRRLGIVKGKKAKKLKPTETAKAIAKDNLNAEFMRVARLNADEEVTGVESLNGALGFIKMVIEEHKKGTISASNRRIALEKLAPSLNEMIDSKYWEGNDKKGIEIAAGRPRLLGQPDRPPVNIFGDTGRPRNIYADQYNSALAKLELMSSRANTETGRVIVMSNILKHVEIASRLENGSKEQQEKIQNIARDSVIDLMYELHQETKDIPYDEYPTSIATRTPVALDSIQPADETRRPDGSLKATGFLGVLEMDDGRTTTEQSIDTEINGKETLIPLIVSTTTEEDLGILLSDIELKNIPNSIIDKAKTHAKKRIDNGLSPFIEIAPQGAIDKMKQDLNNKTLRKSFVDNFGQSTLDKIDDEDIISVPQIQDFTQLFIDFKNGELTKDEFIKKAEAIR